MFIVVLPIFLLLGLLDTWVPREEEKVLIYDKKLSL
jgi:hypothetical protein